MNLSNNDWELTIDGLKGHFKYINKNAAMSIEGTLKFEDHMGVLFLMDFTGVTVLPYYVENKLREHNIYTRSTAKDAKLY